MIIRVSEFGSIRADLSLTDVTNLLRALERQIKADEKAHPFDAAYCRKMRLELSRALDRVKAQGKAEAAR